MDRVTRYNVLAMSGRAVEAAGDVDTLLLDKTGTITFGNRLAAELVPVGGHTAREVARAALDASRGDDTPEGQSIVALAQQQLGAATERRTGRRSPPAPRRSPSPPRRAPPACATRPTTARRTAPGR